MCNGGAMQYIQYIYFMYVCKYVCEKYIKSISYKTAVVFRVHVDLYHFISRLQKLSTGNNQQRQNFY